MLKHLFKLIWNKKKQHFLLMVEMLFSFLVMFAVFTLVVYNYQNYNRPMGFAYENVWAVSYFNEGRSTENEDSLTMLQDLLKRTVNALPEVKGITYVNNNSPFSMSNMNSNTSYGKINTMSSRYDADDDYVAVLEPIITHGRWFSKADDGAKLPPAVINITLKETFFPHEEAVGKVIHDGEKEVRIVGVIRDMKDKGDYQAPESALFSRVGGMNRMLVRIIADAPADLESRLHKLVARTVGDGKVEIEHLADKRVVKNNITLIPLLIFMVIAGFLIINVSLGLFGVLWYTISKRKAEIGLRRAMGATGKAIARQVVSETLVLGTLSLLVGVFFAVQFPLLDVFDMPSGVYFTAIGLAVLFIYVLVVICAFYPGRQAANIYPAVALHED